MTRLLVSLFAACAILLSGLTSAWAAAPSAAAAPQASHCHHGAGAMSAAGSGGDCCKHCISCDHACSAPTALLAPPPALDDFVAAHFDALHAAPGLFPAYALDRFKPPIAPLS